MPSANPLDWPSFYPRTAQRKAASFRCTFGQAIGGVHKELKALGAGGIVISTNLPLKADGMPYASASRVKLPDPAVAVYFTPWKGRPSVVACDAWDRVEHNLQAVRRTLEALRAIERHGTSQVQAAAYAGLALPAGPEPVVGEEPWWLVLELPRNATADVIREKARKLLTATFSIVADERREELKLRIMNARGRALDQF